VDPSRPRGRHRRDPDRGHGTLHRDRPPRLVHLPGLLQRHPGRTGRGPSRPGAHQPTRSRLGDARALCPGGVGDRDLPGPLVRPVAPAHVHRALSPRRGCDPRLRQPPPRPTAVPGRQASLVPAGAGDHVLRRSSMQPGLRLGVPQPVPAGDGLCVPRHLSGLLPDGSGGNRGVGGAAPGVPGDGGAVRGARRGLTGGRPAVGPDRTAQGLRHRRSRSLRVRAVRHRRCGRLQRLPGRHGPQRDRLRHLHGRRPALVVDVLPDDHSAAKDLGVLNIAGALPFAVAPALAPALLAIGNGSYGFLYAVAGGCALLGAAAVVPVRAVR
jgi:hypothetical protein